MLPYNYAIAIVAAVAGLAIYFFPFFQKEKPAEDKAAVKAAWISKLMVLAEQATADGEPEVASSAKTLILALVGDTRKASR